MAVKSKDTKGALKSRAKKVLTGRAKAIADGRARREKSMKKKK